MPQSPPTTVSVAGTIQGIGHAVQAFDRFCAANGLDSPAANPFRVALDEVLSNIVRHAYAGVAEASIDVSFSLRGRDLEVTIADVGPPLNPLTLPDPDTTAPLEARKPGGLGVYLVKRLMDRVDYAYRDGQNHLVLTRRIVG
jgi:serine/threonine-protein kinase RsbW